MINFKGKNILRILSVTAVIFATITILFILKRYYLPSTNTIGFTTLSLAPSSQKPLPTANTFGDTVNLDILIDTPERPVSIITLTIQFDPNSLQFVENSFKLNKAISTLTTLDDPIFSKESLFITLNADQDNKQNIFQSRTKLASFVLKVIGKKDKSTTVSFSKQTQAFTVGAKNQAGENIPTNTKNVEINIIEMKTSTPSAIPTNTKNLKIISPLNSTSSAKTTSPIPTISQ